MSGWNPQALVGLVFGLFLVVMGLLQWLDPVIAKRQAEAAHERRLRYGDVGTDLRRVEQPERWVGLVLIVSGGLYLLLPRPAPQNWVFPTLFGGFLLVMSLWGLWAVHRRGGRPRLSSLVFILFGGAFLALGLNMPR